MYCSVFRRFAPLDSSCQLLGQSAQLSSRPFEEARALVHLCPSAAPKLFDWIPDPCTAWLAESKAAADWRIEPVETEFESCTVVFSTSADRSAINVGSSSTMSRIRVRHADSMRARTVSSPEAFISSPRDASSLFSTDFRGTPPRPKIRTTPSLIHDHASVVIAVTSADDAALIRSSTTNPPIRGPTRPILVESRC